ncbi:P-loop NTPase [Candidatus Woesearchaeota archaeon]|jgi:septum site-determining protein MinD|nr:P-loop NTPase [Candidatus Woesearchaeota archaeon]MBT4151247.1 P-loop NTPase [Candidatus Woesearchaeota archaeon]MBT4247280.1 P-loop NTPase [Candidatus Woesearchaeota archaeon]MBT4433993.1 P-loop NTPase [Candidatus Woesearchaeota archaeon]MBT7332390.1 P-loop NTPase [Candidatus Woesearchaeota archaeon]
MTKFIAVASGKGGVGKTTSTLNIGQALINIGKRVVLVDANLVTPNLALQLGLVNPEGTINKFLRKEKSLKDVTYLHETGLSVIPASPSYHEFQKTNSQNLTEVFEHLDDTTDFVLLDSPSGLGYEVSHVIKHSDEVLVIVNPHLSSVMDALKTMQLAKANDTMVAGIVMNMSHKGKHEMSPLEVEQILGLPIIANIRHSKKMRKALHKQMPATYLYPRSKVGKEFRKIAEHLTLHKNV